MIAPVTTQADREAFAVAAVDFSRSYPNGIVRFYVSERHAPDASRNFFFRDGNLYRAFLYRDHGKVRGRIAAFINRAMVFDGKQVGTVGAFDCTEDYTVAEALLRAAVDWLTGNHCSVIWGPMDFSIWHHYRFMTRGFDSYPFVGEPRNPPYYPAFFERFGFVARFTWESQILRRSDLLTYADTYRSQAAVMDKLGYVTVRLDKRNRDMLMHETWQAIMQAYKVFPGFIPVTETVFMDHYSRMPDLLDKDCSVFLRSPQGDFAGFILVVQDLRASLNAMNGRTNLPAKLRFLLHRHHAFLANLAQAAVLPTYIRDMAVQGRARFGEPVAAGGALICKAVQNILSTGRYQEAIFSLMRQEAHVRNHAIGMASEKREYTLYELKKPSV